MSEHTAENDALHTLATKCRERLDLLPTWAQPSWYRLHAKRPMPPTTGGDS